mmetsp:Transcript_11845/g.23261  ORF Transcript_11845/g.23261 Transcript_11845/m.23261 type:complete len:202 (+) Transcript_11845:781-1386(+)
MSEQAMATVSGSSEASKSMSCLMEEKLLCSNLSAFSFQNKSSCSIDLVSFFERSSCAWRSKVLRTLKLRLSVSRSHLRLSRISMSVTFFLLASCVRIFGSLASITASQSACCWAGSADNTMRIAARSKRVVGRRGSLRKSRTMVLRPAWSTRDAADSLKQESQMQSAKEYCELATSFGKARSARSRSIKTPARLSKADRSE